MEFIRRFLFLPWYMVLIGRAHQALDRRDWAEAAETIEKIHCRGFRTSSSRHFLGLALLQMHRWDEAVEQYESIEKPVRDPASNSWRLLNHSIALYEVGRMHECAELLRSSIDDTWAEEPLRRAKGMLAEFQNEQ